VYIFVNSAWQILNLLYPGISRERRSEELHDNYYLDDPVEYYYTYILQPASSGIIIVSSPRIPNTNNFIIDASGQPKSIITC